jgi:hypothetical protein
VREPDRRDTLPCPGRASSLTGLGVPETIGASVTAGSESGSRVLAGCGEPRFSKRSAASAPAIRICSAVTVVEPDFFSRALGLVRAGAGDSEGGCSEGDAACSGAFDFVSRATITSCAWTLPKRTRLQSAAKKHALSTKSADEDLRPIEKPL